MKSNTFFEMTNEELNNKVQELKKQLFELRFKQSVSKLSNPLSINECKKDIARALTILRQRQLGISEEPTKTVKKKTTKSKA
ncbi:MAG: 50S ribosomal protein L29 [Clostridia bacterium]|jgi:large subunit ribosomal protein L29|nr:50S ribosomal protein L29 [Clostridia bacterium]